MAFLSHRWTVRVVLESGLIQLKPEFAKKNADSGFLLLNYTFILNKEENNPINKKENNERSVP